MRSPYRPGPLPAQQGSSPQVGLPTGAFVPIASQQQHPLQSVHDARVALGWHTASHAAVELPPPVLDEPPPVDDEEPPVDPVLPPAPVLPPPVSLPHPMIPTVDEAPVTTKT